MASKLLSNEFQKHICLDYECTTIEEAIHKAGDLLVQVGCVKPPYINGMIRREQETSTDIGFGVIRNRYFGRKIRIITVKFCNFFRFNMSWFPGE